MLSKKLTFSLTSLVVLLAFGLIYAVPSAMGADPWWMYEPKVKLSATDVSSAGGTQVEGYAQGTFNDAGVFSFGDGKDIEFYIKLNSGKASLNSTALTDTSNLDGDGDKLHISDLRFILYDKDGVELAKPDADPDPDYQNMGLLGGASGGDAAITHANTAAPDGKNFKVTLDSENFSSDTLDTVAMLVHLPGGSFRNIAPDVVAEANADAKGRRPAKNERSPKENHWVLNIVPAEPTGSGLTGPIPKVVSIVRIVDTASVGGSRFQTAEVSGPFQVRVTLTEAGKDFGTDKINVVRGTATSIVPGVPFRRDDDDNALLDVPQPSEGNYAAFGNIPSPSGRDQLYHPYLVTITPDLKERDDVEIRVEMFDDMVIPAKSFVPPTNYALAINRSLLAVPVNVSATTIVTDPALFKPSTDAKKPNEVFIPDGLVIPAGGYLVLTQGKADQSGVDGSTAKLVDKKKLSAQKQLYNVKNEVGFPAPGNDLEALFRVGGTIRLSHADIAGNTAAAGAKVDENGYLVSNTVYTAGSVVISEIMWGRDISLGDADAVKSQWIELHNPGTAAISIDKNEWKLAFYQGSGGTAGAGLIDEVSNASPYWIAPGSSGATKSLRSTEVKAGGTVDKDAIVSTIVETFDLATLTSMYRKIDGANVMSGTSADSWAASPIAGSLNVSANRAGTPGAATPYTAPAPTPEPEPEPEPMAPVATASDLRITEVMVASNDGRLPQWIEIANIGAAAVSLTGWSISIDNDPADTDVIAPSVNLKLGDVTIGKDQVALVVSKSGRNSGVGTAEGNLRADRIIDVQKDVSTVAQYSLISDMAFRISLIPPLPSGVVDRGDVVGNLGQGWELPMSEGSRSSLIRREMGTTAEIMGTDAAGWVLAADTSLVGAYVETYYGDKDDMGTPGYDAGGALPVELSKFSAARDRVTGQVTIAWETQSELNNAGFFIKRSQQRNGQFTVVNPTMIPGAGTISEKQSYTYTDTTAKPNIVYYYQIEDVSLDGQRQILTRAHRLKGHIGAAGKATTTWGELKTSLEQ